MRLTDKVREMTGRPALILDCGRDEFPEFLTEMGCMSVAEIGVYKAEFTVKLCKAGLRVYGIDPWASFDGAGRSQQRQDRQDFLYGHASRAVAPYPNCKLIRKTSMEALSDFEDGSLDAIFIDGDHSFRYIAEDICEWPKKVRKGGIVAGHDYFDTIPEAKNLVCQVKSVVNAYTQAFGIENWYAFGLLDPELEPDRKERFLSWMWTKR